MVSHLYAFSEIFFMVLCVLTHSSILFVHFLMYELLELFLTSDKNIYIFLIRNLHINCALHMNVSIYIKKTINRSKLALF